MSTIVLAKSERVSDSGREVNYLCAPRCVYLSLMTTVSPSIRYYRRAINDVKSSLDLPKFTRMPRAKLEFVASKLTFMRKDGLKEQWVLN